MSDDEYKFVEVELVATRFVVVAFVAVKPTMFATEAFRVLMTPFVKSAIGEKRDVEVALPRVGETAGNKRLLLGFAIAILHHR